MFLEVNDNVHNTCNHLKGITDYGELKKGEKGLQGLS